MTDSLIERLRAKQPLVEWVRDRHANCLRLANLKPIEDRAGWLEDADYFAQILSRLAEATPEVDTLRAELALYKQAFSLCSIHTPDLWEGDGTCVICEATRLAEATPARPLTPILHLPVEMGHGTQITFEDNSQRVWACGCYEDQGGYHFCAGRVLPAPKDDEPDDPRMQFRTPWPKPLPAPAQVTGRQVPESAVRCLNSHGHARCIHIAGHFPPCDWEVG